VTILYAAQLSPNDSAQYRAWALERLGHTVHTLNCFDYQPASRLLRKVVHRAQAGPWVGRLNRDILAAAEREKPDIFWADKLLGLQPKTLDRLREMGIATVSYMIDNAFGPRRDPGWRLYMKDIPHFDLHVVQRDKNIADYMERGARNVIKIQTAYEPTIHFPSPHEITDEQRTRGVSFIGTSYDDRPAFLTRLWREFGIPVVISGDRMWKVRLEPDAAAALYTGAELYGKEYREAIWHSKINLSFITHSNQDEFVHKSFEIAACGGFLLAERSDGHKARFLEDEEAVFFTGFDECLEKIRKYLPDEAARTRIASAGRERAVRDGYSNDAQVAKIVERLVGLKG
jgi:spore maturation protein CgeB